MNDGGGGNGYDIDWIINEIESNIYLGTTWGCHPHYAQEYVSLLGVVCSLADPIFLKRFSERS